MKHDKAVAKAILPIPECITAYFIEEAKKIGETYGMWVDTQKKEKINDPYQVYSEGGFRLQIQLYPKAYMNETPIRNPKTKNRLFFRTVIDINSPYVSVDLALNDSVIEGTDKHVSQYHFYVRTHGFMETRYHCRNIESFADYKSFDYDTDDKTIAKSFCDSVKQILDAYEPLIK